MPRPSNLVKKIPFKVRVSEEIYTKLELEVYDPTYVGKTRRYNVRNEIVEAALRMYFRAREDAVKRVKEINETKEIEVN